MVIRILVAVLFPCTFLFSGKLWEQKPYSEWTQKEAFEFLEKSPWCKDQKVRRLSIPSDNRGGSSELEGLKDRHQIPKFQRYFIRFHSARPVLMALARIAILQRRQSVRQAREFVEIPPFGGSYIVVGVSLVPGEDLSELKATTTETLGPHTNLFLKGSGRKIVLERYVPPRGRSQEGYFLFPRTRDGQDLITLKDKEVRFVSLLPWLSRLDRKFKLKDMRFRGILEF